ncbi:hypothetical protein FJY84_05220 [Candidatus Bathyarchaeota archaeon]|nr:hypothetical protein [Candidatus Bathyarchaeota archaeon]
MRRYATFAALILIALIFPASIYAWQNSQIVSSEKSSIIALNFLKNAPTFMFDGIEDSIKIIKVSELEKYPTLYIVQIGFSCRHSGYGDRTGQNLLQVISPHLLIVHIENNRVLKAEIDGKWNEISQTPLYTQQGAEETALIFLFECTTFKFDGITTSIKLLKSAPLRMLYTWEVTYEFQCEHPGYGRYKLLTQKITTHTIRVVVTEGKVIQAIVDNVWDEINQKYVLDDTKPIREPLTIETARDIALKYFVTKFKISYVLPQEWAIKNLTPDKILGYQAIQYSSGPWRVTIKNSIVLYPTYDVTVDFMTVKGIFLHLTVDQKGNVTEKK